MEKISILKKILTLSKREKEYLYNNFDNIVNIVSFEKTAQFDGDGIDPSQIEAKIRELVLRYISHPEISPLVEDYSRTYDEGLASSIISKLDEYISHETENMDPELAEGVSDFVDIYDDDDKIPLYLGAISKPEEPSVQEDTEITQKEEEDVIELNGVSYQYYQDDPSFLVPFKIEEGTGIAIYGKEINGEFQNIDVSALNNIIGLFNENKNISGPITDEEGNRLGFSHKQDAIEIIRGVTESIGALGETNQATSNFYRDIQQNIAEHILIHKIAENPESFENGEMSLNDAEKDHIERIQQMSNLYVGQYEASQEEIRKIEQIRQEAEEKGKQVAPKAPSYKRNSYFCTTCKQFFGKQEDTLQGGSRAELVATGKEVLPPDIETDKVGTEGYKVETAYRRTPVNEETFQNVCIGQFGVGIPEEGKTYPRCNMVENLLKQERETTESLASIFTYDQPNTIYAGGDPVELYNRKTDQPLIVSDSDNKYLNNSLTEVLKTGRLDNEDARMFLHHAADYLELFSGFFPSQFERPNVSVATFKPDKNPEDFAELVESQKILQDMYRKLGDYQFERDPFFTGKVEEMVARGFTDIEDRVSFAKDIMSTRRIKAITPMLAKNLFNYHMAPGDDAYDFFEMEVPGMEDVLVAGEYYSRGARRADARKTMELIKGKLMPKYLGYKGKSLTAEEEYRLTAEINNDFLKMARFGFEGAKKGRHENETHVDFIGGMILDEDERANLIHELMFSEEGLNIPRTPQSLDPTGRYEVVSGEEDYMGDLDLDELRIRPKGKRKEGTPISSFPNAIENYLFMMAAPEKIAAMLALESNIEPIMNSEGQEVFHFTGIPTQTAASRKALANLAFPHYMIGRENSSRTLAWFLHQFASYGHLLPRGQTSNIYGVKKGKKVETPLGMLLDSNLNLNRNGKHLFSPSGYNMYESSDLIGGQRGITLQEEREEKRERRRANNFDWYKIAQTEKKNREYNYVMITSPFDVAMMTKSALIANDLGMQRRELPFSAILPMDYFGSLDNVISFNRDPEGSTKAIAVDNEVEDFSKRAGIWPVAAGV